MKRQILAGAMVLALATGMTTSAMAFGHGGGGHVGGFGGHAGGFGAHVGGMGGMHSFGGSRFAEVRGYGAWGHGGWGGRRFVGGYGYGGSGYPYYDTYAGDLVGLGLAGVATGYCGPYDYDYGYCGQGFVPPVAAW
jgi:hypothetical protein